ncbi:hypothetical protein H0G86_000693 [Trichoderma simmonsii]|uniref:Uncharacterized protein n=1 Tax=Trichoderma simmonsii TaxID=1491479 RepID=A0A8G0PBN6_9HYPO|nr:hypothetical protein H0G86_000693 [Trichoderma simmonsii]
MEISISESLKGPSCTMAAILITLPSHPSEFPSQFPSQYPSNSIQFHLYIQIPIHLYPSQIPPLSSSKFPSHYQFPTNPITQSNPNPEPEPSTIHPIHPLCHGNSSTPQEGSESQIFGGRGRIP